MSNLLFHPFTNRDVTQLLNNPPQSVLIIGKAGSGTDTTARYIASQLLDTSHLENHPYFFCIPFDTHPISIDQIRELQQFLKLKVAGRSKGINRVIIIEKAGRMGAEAQNALLKTLEEPPLGSCIILTAYSSEELLNTITSRTRPLQVLPVSEVEAKKFFSNKNPNLQDFERIYALSGGGAALLATLVEGRQNELIDVVNLAKQILAEPIGQRLLRTDELAKNKLAVQGLLDGFYRICHAGLRASALKNTEKAVAQWQAREKHVIDTIVMHKKNANTKLMLDALFMNI